MSPVLSAGTISFPHEINKQLLNPDKKMSPRNCALGHSSGDRVNDKFESKPLKIDVWGR